MSEWKVEVIKLGEITRHENADNLEITKVLGGYPCIMKSGQFKPNDLAVYIPVDSLVNKDNQRFAFLGDHLRIKAKRLRGVFSMGLLIPAESDMKEGEDVAERLGITKYEPPLEGTGFGGGQDDVSPPFAMNVYTDIEGLRRWQDVLVPGEEVIFVEKVHCENMRVSVDENRLWVGSRTRIKKLDGTGGWVKAAHKFQLEEKLRRINRKIVLYGESAGYTGGFPYGVAKGDVGFFAFDIFDRELGRYVDFDEFLKLTDIMEVPIAPVLYRGPWSMEKAFELAEGQSTIDNRHVREGVVIRPVKERWHDELGRTILKLHGEGFLTNKHS